MKLEFRKIENAKEQSLYLWYLDDLVIAWLAYNQIHVGTKGKDFRVSYNDFYHFYDIEMFELRGNTNRDRHIYEVEDFFNNKCYKTSKTHTWRWEGDVNIPGQRIWVYARDEVPHG